MSLFPLTQYDFPNVSNYDSDLREILALCRKLIEDYNTLVSGLNELDDGYKDLVKQFNEVKREFNALERLVNEYSEQIDERVAAAIAVWSDAFIERIEALTQYVHDETEIFTTLVNTIRNDFDTLVNSAKDYADLKDAEIVAQFNVELNEINRRIDELVFELPDVYNVTRGYNTDFVTLVYDIYDATRDHAYTATQFDTAGLTATELDAMNETAFVLDTNGYYLLYPVGLVNNPYTGLKEDINSVLEQIAQAAAGLTSINASEFDALDKTCTEFEAYNMTCFMFDMYAKQIMTA